MTFAFEYHIKEVEDHELVGKAINNLDTGLQGPNAGDFWTDIAKAFNEWDKYGDDVGQGMEEEREAIEGQVEEWLWTEMNKYNVKDPTQME